MHPLFILGAIVGAFMLGRKTADKDLPKIKGPIPSPIPLPLPPGDDDVIDVDVIDVPPGLDIPATSSQPTPRQIANAAAWAKIGYSAALYPKGGDKTLTPPPSSASSVSASPDCSVIAVGERFFDRAGQVAQQLQAQNALSQTNLFRALLPTLCRTARTRAAVDLRADLLEHAQQAYGPIRNYGRSRRSRWRSR